MAMKKKKAVAEPKSEPVAQDRRERPYLGLNPEEIKHEYTRISAELARFGEILADATRDAAFAKQKRDQVHASVYLDMVEGAEALQEKKPSEGVLKAKIQASVQYQGAVHAYIRAEHVRLTAFSDMEALRAKRDMVISLGAHVRQELKSDPSLYDEEGTTKDDEDDE